VTGKILASAIVAVAALASTGQTPPSPADTSVTSGGAQAFPGDFDFLIGEWSVVNRRRRTWLANDEEWLEFPSTCRFWKTLEGMVVQDECRATRDGRTHAGGAYRIYDPGADRWTVYWASTAYPELGLVRQVAGRVRQGKGELFGEEEFEGRTVRLRFRWERLSDREVCWEQAYQDPASGEWETNWTMGFTRR